MQGGALRKRRFAALDNWSPTRQFFRVLYSPRVRIRRPQSPVLLLALMLILIGLITATDAGIRSAGGISWGAGGIDRVEVWWPVTGQTNIISGLQMDRFYQFTEGD